MDIDMMPMVSVKSVNDTTLWSVLSAAKWVNESRSQDSGTSSSHWTTDCLNLVEQIIYLFSNMGYQDGSCQKL